MKNSVVVIKENPLWFILFSLAMKIGSWEAFTLQQIHYWLSNSIHMIEERSLIYNTYKDWQKQIHLWSKTTGKRSFLNLEGQGLLTSGIWNVLKLATAKRYTRNYEKKSQFGLILFGPSCDPLLEHYRTRTTAGLVQSSSNTISRMDPIELSNVSEGSIDGKFLTQAIPESTSENTSIKEISIVEFLDYLHYNTNSTLQTNHNRRGIKLEVFHYCRRYSVP